jgi:hypothetical protein
MGVNFRNVMDLMPSLFLWSLGISDSLRIIHPMCTFVQINLYMCMMKLFVEDRIVMLVQRTVMDVCSNFQFMWQSPVQGWSGRVALK